MGGYTNPQNDWGQPFSLPGELSEEDLKMLAEVLATSDDHEMAEAIRSILEKHGYPIAEIATNAETILDPDHV